MPHLLALLALAQGSPPSDPAVPEPVVLWSRAGSPDEGGFGFACSRGGDVNGDGVPDWIVTAPFNSPDRRLVGSVHVISGRDGGDLLVLSGEEFFRGDGYVLTEFGFAAAGIDDVDGDGFGDVVVTAFERDLAGERTGVVRAFSGATAEPLHVVRTPREEDPGDGYGERVGHGGDLNGDGFPDYWISAPRATFRKQVAGAVHFLSGQRGNTFHISHGGVEDGGYGADVARAGDVDGDGADDLVIGAPERASSGTRNGRVRLVSGRSGKALFNWNGPAPGSLLGSSVAGGHDLDGDGVPDVAAAAPGDGTGPGRVLVWSGSSGEVLTELEVGPAIGAEGVRVVSPGDVDGDGRADLVLVEPGRDERGYPLWRVRCMGDGRVVWALDHLPDGRPMRSAPRAEPVGDVNGDGRADLLLCAPFHSTEHPYGASGMAAVLGLPAPGASAPAAGPDPRAWAASHGVLRRLEPPRPQASVGGRPGFATRLGAPGDVDGDGRADLLVGSWDGGDRFSHQAFVFSGADGSRLLDVADDWLLDVAAVGDVDGDGRGDVAVISLDELNRGSPAGDVWILSGRNVALLPPHPLASWVASAVVVRPAGDVDGDGLDDLLVGRPEDDIRDGVPQNDQALVVSTADGRTLLEWSSDTAEDQFGAALAAVGDVDGDGRGDFAVGAPEAGEIGRDPRSAPGAARVFSSADGRELLAVEGEAEGDALGSSVAALGDVDGDGRADVLLGAPGAREARGHALVVSGADGSVLWRFEGAEPGARAGAAVASLADLDGDGVREVVVGAPGGSGPRWRPRGRVHVLSGASGALLLTLNDEDDAPIPGAFGSTLVDAGDVDGDGTGDLLVGAPYQRGKTDRGSAWVFSGAWLREHLGPP